MINKINAQPKAKLSSPQSNVLSARTFNKNPEINDISNLITRNNNNNIKKNYLQADSRNNTIGVQSTIKHLKLINVMNG